MNTLENRFKICVNTAVGVTDTVSIGDCVGQGSSGAGLISQANIGLGLQKHFGETVEVAHYGDIRIQPLAWQDDLGVPNENVSMARNNNKRMEEMLMEKLLEAHPDKSVYIVTGTSSFKKKVREELTDLKNELEKFKESTFNRFDKIMGISSPKSSTSDDDTSEETSDDEQHRDNQQQQQGPKDP